MITHIIHTAQQQQGDAPLLHTRRLPSHRPRTQLPQAPAGTIKLQANAPLECDTCAVVVNNMRSELHDLADHGHTETTLNQFKVHALDKVREHCEETRRIDNATHMNCDDVADLVLWQKNTTGALHQNTQIVCSYITRVDCVTAGGGVTDAQHLQLLSDYDYCAAVPDDYRCRVCSYGTRTLD